MSKTTEKAKSLLAGLDKRAKTPFRFHDVATPDEVAAVGAVVGAFRDSRNQNLLEPHQESASMVVTFPETRDFLVAAPTIIQELLDEIEAEEASHQPSREAKTE